MGRIVKFDPRRRKRGKWTRPAAYGVSQPARFRRKPAGKPRRGRKRDWPVGFAWLLILLMAFAWAAWDSKLFSSPDTLLIDPQQVDARWTFCGLGRGRYCVVDGDTFRIGDTSFRLLGLDTPEREARCEREALKADAARAALLAWLNEGPFTMAGRAGSSTDKYGRQLREVWREEGGQRRTLAQAMIDAGLAREYHGGAREDWCG
jgi:micrococcal nuclease